MGSVESSISSNSMFRGSICEKRMSGRAKLPIKILDDPGPSPEILNGQHRDKEINVFGFANNKNRLKKANVVIFSSSMYLTLRKYLARKYYF